MNSGHSKKSSKSRHRPRNSGGIALVSVLWVLLLLSGLAATVASIARIDALLTRRSFELARAQAAADAAIVEVLSRLADEQTSRRPALGAAQVWEFGDIPTTTTVNNEAERIDINAASPQVLAAFLHSHAVAPELANALIGNLVQAKPLETTAQLWGVPGWHEQDLRCWMSSLTVFTKRPDVAVPDATGGSAHSLLGEVLRIRSSATVANVTASSEWIGRLTGDSARPTLTLRWDQGLTDDPQARCVISTPAAPE